MQNVKSFLIENKSKAQENIITEAVMRNTPDVMEITIPQQRIMRELVHDMGGMLTQAEFGAICNVFYLACERLLKDQEGEE